ncbi:thymidine phosphorylase [Elusimicrobiota bacterium]
MTSKPRFSYPDFIEPKKAGNAWSKHEIFTFAQAVKDSAIPDYQIAAILMAIRLKGLTHKEAADLTDAMTHFSDRINLRGVRIPIVDKHSTGGVGDGVSLVLAPWAAALGLAVPMMSGRSLGLTGGTLDKLSSIPGFRVDLNRFRVQNQVKKIGVAMFGQTKDIAPVDRKLYALRDVTRTVDSLPLIVSSILSKKLVEDIKVLVLDVKFGSGAIFAHRKDALILAKSLLQTSRCLGVKTKAVMSHMDEPLGRAAGNAVEIEQAVRILESGDGPEDFMEVAFELMAQLLILSRKADSRKKAYAFALRALKNGSAHECFMRMLKYQGATGKVSKDVCAYLPRPKKVITMRSTCNGYVAKVCAKKIAQATLCLGALRHKENDRIDYSAGVILEKKRRDKISRGEPLGRLHTSTADKKSVNMAEGFFREAYKFSRSRPPSSSVIYRVI